MELWTLIVQSNTFNFIIMVGLLAFIIKKCKLSQKLDDAILKIKESIDNSELANKNSLSELKDAQEFVKNVQSEISEIEQKADENITNIENKMAKETDSQVSSILSGAQKIIDAKEREIVSKLSKKTVMASFEVAKNHIINLLQQNPDYHQKFIKESIEELDRLKS